MNSTLYLAYRYIRFHRVPTALLVAALSLMMMVPVATRQIIQRFRASAMQRAQQTPLVIGAKGSSFGLALHALYFRGDVPRDLTYSQFERLEGTRLGQFVPLLARYRTADHLIVGTSREYLIQRGLFLAQGQPWERWGDCLVGWNAAKTLRIAPGDTLLSEPENMLDIAGPAPLRLRVRGILQPTGQADDDVVFCHLETAWIMAGIGHGHSLGQRLENSVTEPPHDQPAHAHNAEDTQHYSEITAENLRSFHFHGNRADYPLTAILAFPDSDRSAALLEGKYLEPDQPCQIVEPVRIVGEFLQLVARLQQLLDAISALLGLTTLMLVGLVIWLSLRLRAAELRTFQLLGASRLKIGQIVAAELGLIVVLSCLVAWGLSFLLVQIIF